MALFAKPAFSSWQMEKIRWGIRINPTMELIKRYAKPEINANNMQEILWAIEEGFTADQIEVMTNPKFKDMQLKEIRDGFKLGLTVEQVNIYAKPELWYNQMILIKNALLDNYEKWQIDLLSFSKFSQYQLEEISKGIALGLTFEQINSYANPDLPWMEMNKRKRKILCQELKQTLSEEY